MKGYNKGHKNKGGAPKKYYHNKTEACRKGGKHGATSLKLTPGNGTR